MTRRFVVLLKCSTNTRYSYVSIDYLSNIIASIRQVARHGQRG